MFWLNSWSKLATATVSYSRVTLAWNGQVAADRC
jgi:hypothetical protein